MSPRVLVTGSSGFVGRSLVPLLRARGCDVGTLGAVDAAGGAAALVARVVEHQPDVVINLATRFAAEHDIEQIPELIRANVEFGTVVAEGAVRAGARLIVVDSAWQHFEGRDYAPVSLYAATKQALKVITDYYVEVQGLDRRSVVLFDTYGPGDVRPKLIPSLMRAVLTGKPLEMSDGLQLIDLTYIDDVCRGIAQIALADDAAEASVLRTGHPSSIRDVVIVLEGVVERPVPVIWGARTDRPREMREDWVLGDSPADWSPRVRLSEGLAQTWLELQGRNAQ